MSWIRRVRSGKPAVSVAICWVWGSAGRSRNDELAVILSVSACSGVVLTDNARPSANPKETIHPYVFQNPAVPGPFCGCYLRVGGYRLAEERRPPDRQDQVLRRWQAVAGDRLRRCDCPRLEQDRHPGKRSGTADQGKCHRR